MPDELHLGGLVVDFARHELRRGEHRTRLTARESELLAYLWERQGEPVTRAQLLVEVWGYAPRVVSRAADYTVHRLRQKLEPTPAEPQWLVTIPGVGFQLEVGAPMPVPTPTPADVPVSRDAELGAVRQALGVGRLVTLSGPAGVGKTWLARRLCAECDAVFVDLTEARDVDSMCVALAATLQMPRLGAQPIEEIGTELHDRVVVLDNLEQVIEPAAAAIARWLEMAPTVRIVATSRTLLRLRGEQVVEVAPLSEAAAISLLLARAREQRPDWGADASPQVLAGLVSELDRLPLALELAAARCALLSPEALLKRLTDRFATLGRGRRGDTPRQASLWGALSWSWDLLLPAERSALSQLSVFRGGFTVDAAEQVVQLPPGSPLVLDVVHGLREQSLVHAAGDRLDLLLSVRDFAQQAGQLGEAAQRHWAWATAHGEALSARWRETGDPAAMQALEAESNNLAVAAKRATDPVPVLLASEALWLARGPIGPWLRRLDEALDAAHDQTVRMRLLAARAKAGASYAQPGGQPKRDALDALSLARGVGDQDCEAEVLLTLAILERAQGDSSSAWVYRDELEPLLQQSASDSLRLRAALNLANLHHFKGDLVASEAAYREALDAATTLGHTKAIGTIVLNLAVTVGGQGRHAQQRDLAQSALSTLDEARDRRLVSGAQLCLGSAHLWLGEHADAGRVLTLARAGCQRTGDRHTEAEVLLALAMLSLAQGEPTDARRCAGDAAAIFGDLGLDQGQGEAVGYHAIANWFVGEPLPGVAAELDQALALLDEESQRGRAWFASKRLVVEALCDASQAEMARDAIRALAAEHSALQEAILCDLATLDGTAPTADVDVSPETIVSRRLREHVGNG